MIIQRKNTWKRRIFQLTKNFFVLLKKNKKSDNNKIEKIMLHRIKNLKVLFIFYFDILNLDL